jgi:hypothetical protein
MLRLGDAATLCPEASASTLFQCARRCDARAPGLSLQPHGHVRPFAPSPVRS